MRPLAAKFLKFDAALDLPYPAYLYSWRLTRQLRRQLDGRYGTAVATAVERSFCRDDLPRIFTRAAQFHSAAAVPLAERFWGRLTLPADRWIFRDSVISLPDYLTTPEAINYLRLHTAITGGAIQPRPCGNSGGKGTTLAPFSADPAKCWPLRNFAALLPHLPRPVVIVGGATDREAAESLAGPGVVNRCGETDLAELAELVARCELVIGVDSGVANLGIVLGRKVLAATGEANRRFMTLPETFARYGFRLPKRIAAPSACPEAGCNYRCPRVRPGRPYPCVENITVAAFREALETSVD